MTTLSSLARYGHSFQTKVLGALLTQRDFLLNLADSLDSEYFDNQAAKWIIEYNSIRIGQHHISFQDTDNKENIDFYTNPMIGLRDYQQQVPLEYYFVDTSPNIRKDNIDKAIIL